MTITTCRGAIYLLKPRLPRIYIYTCCIIFLYSSDNFHSFSTNSFLFKACFLSGTSVIYKSTRLEITSLQWNHLQIIQACLPQRPPFSQHILWQCCNCPDIPSSIAGILLFNSVFYDGVTPVSVSTLKPPLEVIVVLPMKPQASPILSVCI